MAIGLAGALLLLEIVLRFLPVREPLETQPVTAENPYLHFKPNNDVLYSSGWNFEVVNRVHVNNYGFVNDQDYDPKAATPLFAIIGDSYVEAAHVPYAQTLQGRVAAVLQPRARVYSFAASGAALSQYLAYARFARDVFQPRSLAIVIIGNDFDESLFEYKQDPGFHYFKRADGAGFALELVPLHPSRLHQILRKSALARYVNSTGLVELATRKARALTGGERQQFVGNVASEVEPERLRKSRDAIDFFLAELPRVAGIAPADIVMVVDGERPHLYDVAELQSVASSYFAQMRRYFLERARAAGYAVVDLQPRFIDRHKRERIRFEWKNDAHWNAYGHEEAAKAVLQTGVPQRLMR